MRGIQTRGTVLQHTTHREERPENDDSISGVCLSDCRIQRRLGTGVGATQGIFALVLRLPLCLQLCSAGRAWRG